VAKKPSGKTGSFFTTHVMRTRYGDLASESSGPLLSEKYYQPPLDIFETTEYVRIEIELPGVLTKDIELYSIGNRIYLEADKYDPSPAGAQHVSERINFICMERKFGRFRREIDLPVSCNTQAAKAAYRDGMLIIKVPKISERRGKRLNIKIEEDE
jgi:HSP20 family protein